MSSSQPYHGREQTEAKHFILRTYLEALVFKVFNFSDVTYVDGFSGPWETRTEDFSDSSFMIAIKVLREAQRDFAARGIKRKVRCYLCERERETYEKLKAAVTPYHQPEEGFDIRTHDGEFTDAIPDICSYIKNSFALIFIDPTGWTGFGFDLIKPLLAPRLTEVIINYMHDFINRAVGMSSAATIASFDPILGGPGWNDRLEPTLAKTDRGVAVEQLFRKTLQEAGNFPYVVSTKIYRPTIDRPYFFLTYATKNKTGLETFRETEYRALKKQAADRSAAKERLLEARTGLKDMFPGMDGAVQRSRVDDFVADEKEAATSFVLQHVRSGPKPFSDVWVAVIHRFVLRITNVKEICVALAKTGKIEKTWAKGKPKEADLIRLRKSLL